MAQSSQKFIARNRAPRVQIEYDVELYGAQKKVELPFVMGVLSDLSGKPTEPLAPVADRKFMEIDVDNFDSRMKSMKPRVASIMAVCTSPGSASQLSRLIATATRRPASPSSSMRSATVHPTGTTRDSPLTSRSRS